MVLVLAQPDYFLLSSSFCSRPSGGEAKVCEGSKALWPPLSTRNPVQYQPGLDPDQNQTHGPELGLVPGWCPQGQTETVHISGERGGEQAEVYR